MRSLPDALAPLANYKQFLLWAISERDGKQIKLPISPRTLQKCDPHNPFNWITAGEALTMVSNTTEVDGIAFVFTRDDPFFFVDVDKCLQADNTWSPVANDMMTRFSGAAVEVSQSGRGLHIIGTAPNPPDHSCKNIALGLELYTESRFIALTGTNIIGSAATQHDLQPVIDLYFPPREATTDQQWTNQPDPAWSGSNDDDELIKKAMKAKSAGGVFGGNASFAALWMNDVAKLSEAYPDPEGDRPYDSSSADAALAQHLAFWTGKNCERIFTLMWKSALIRDKWTRHPTYLQRTILNAVAYQRDVYTGGKKPTPPPTETISTGRVIEPTMVSGYQYLGASLQLELFKGCVYVQDAHKIFIPTGALLKSEQFNATFGGYVFQLDETGDKTTRKAWEAFTESQIIRFPKAESLCFRPALPVGAIVEEEGRSLVNTYAPITITMQEGDPEPFLNHLRKLLPDERDQQILLAYMAACVQHKGVKFQWAPLIQGTEGNGKTLFTRCVAYAIGSCYTHMPPASEISEKFNEWLFGKLFIGIEDVYVPDHKREVIEILKPMITNDRLAKRAMQQSQVMADNFANFMLNSNHKDAIKKTRNDRRFCVFYSSQQTMDDVNRSGMGGDYFPKLYQWLRGGGYAIVANYLATYDIPDELNPAGACHRAPTTTSTDEAVTASMGAVEQEILEAIEEGRPGFIGGWVSSMAVEKLLKVQNMARLVPHNKRRELMQGLGYDYHPALTQGRVNNYIAFDGGKPRLFIQNDHIHRNLATAAEVARIYQECQTLPADKIFVDADSNKG